MIRPAVVDDVTMLRSLDVLCFGAEAWSESLVRAEVEGETRTVLVVELGDVLVAYASIAVAGDVADLMRIAVEPKHRGHGHARALLSALLVAAVDAGAASMMLEVDEGNVAARSLYADLGFAPISRRRHYYADGSDGLVMSLALSPPRGRVEA